MRRGIVLGKESALGAWGGVEVINGLKCMNLKKTLTLGKIFMTSV